MNNIDNMTLKEISSLLQNKKISSYELTAHYINNSKLHEGRVGAYITECFESALEKAKETDNTRISGKRLSPLAGIPFGVKDNISTKGVKTTCASKMLENYVPPFNAEVMNRLSYSVVLGKTNMDEFGMGSGCENSAFKKTCNPLNSSLVSGGSSGGSAAGVAVKMFPFALGSDTGGSVRLPSAFCGVCGLRPTYGRVSRFGLVPFASSMDQIGPIAHCVSDLAMVMTEISGYDKNDLTSAKIMVPNFCKNIADGVKGMKIAVISDVEKYVSNDSLYAIRYAANCLEKAGAYIENVNIPGIDYALPSYYIISSAEASSNLARFDGVKFGYRANEYGNIDEMYKKTRSEAFGNEVKRRIMLGTFVLSRGVSHMYYEKAQKIREYISKEINKIFEKFDCILMPSSVGEAYKSGNVCAKPSEVYAQDFLNVPAALAGIPSVSIPIMKNKNFMPISVQISGKKFDEETILKAAYALEGECGFE